MQKVPKLKFSADKCILKLGYHLASDFQNALADPSFGSAFQSLIAKGDVRGLRNAASTADFHADSYTFKCGFQLDNLLKRYRFEKDLYSDSELMEKAVKAFHETQDRISAISFVRLDATTRLVIRGAKILASQILGSYCDDECRERGRFGKRASVGIPAAKACEGERWEPSISGSSQQISWFDSEMSQNPHVPNYWAQRLDSDPNRSIYQETDVLALTFVPKTFKSLRGIMPNTTIGSYLSYGLGEMIRVRLRKVGLDIKTLQQRHKELARKASVSGFYVTADLSSASDSISRTLVQEILPSDWFHIMDTTRIGKVSLPNGETIESETFCTMGIGYTFPLQTLVFLCLLKSIEVLYFPRNDRRVISVYGDDMIYHVRMHEMVSYHFKELGFILNKDKTYSDGPFRESCGGDYHHGVDVRPFQPQNGSSKVSKTAYEAFLYKLTNGLLRRWTEVEIPTALQYLASELSMITRIKQVPHDFPDDAGIKVDRFHSFAFLRGCPLSRPQHVRDGVFRFSYLRFETLLRKEERHAPYYWAVLRGDNAEVDYSSSGSCRRGRTDLLDHIEQLTGQDRDVPSSLIVKKIAGASSYRSCSTGKRLRRTGTFVVIHNTGSYHRQTGTSRFEVPMS